MEAGGQSYADPTARPNPVESPAISHCESRPGRAVFLESGNTDGWIASNMTVQVVR